MDNNVLKEALYHVFLIDNIVNRFHNKVQFLNLNFMMQRLETWDAARQERVLLALQKVFEDIKAVDDVVNDLHGSGLELVDSYAFIGENTAVNEEL